MNSMGRHKGKSIFSGILFFGLFGLLFSQIHAQQLPVSEPEAVGMSSQQLERLDSLILAAVEKKEFPGAVIVVGRRGRIVFRKAYGECQWIPQPQPMQISMLFDLASLTKPIATATSIMILVEQGKIRLWDKVKDFVSDFKPYTAAQDKDQEPTGKDACLWHLLTHTSGLPPYTDAAAVEKKYGKPCRLDDLVAHIAALEKVSPPGKEFHYSCLGFITLAYIVKKVSGQDIAAFSREHIFQPLNLENTGYNPPDKVAHLCVPTEVIGGTPLRGVVHDPLARVQGGISGNAGLFSTADDLAVIAQMFLNQGEFRDVRILSPLAVMRMTEVYPEVSFSGRGLGWDLNSSYATNGGDLFGPNSFGHTGYTGTSVWIDPDTGTFVIFLTNRVHPHDKGKIVPIRSKVANIVAAAIKN